jgi:hypothetical protein
MKVQKQKMPIEELNIKSQERWRAINPIIGHLKQDHRV